MRSVGGRGGGRKGRRGGEQESESVGRKRRLVQHYLLYKIPALPHSVPPLLLLFSHRYVYET